MAVTKGRGMVTPQIQRVARGRLGREISQQELRLMPYLHNVLLNGRRIDPNMINPEERRILHDWREEGWLEVGAGADVSVTYGFFITLAEILWLGYVVYDSEPGEQQ